MIRFSAALVAVAIGVLIGGIATSKLLLVYIAIVVSAVALLALAIGVVVKREELFGAGQGVEPAGAGAAPVLSARTGESLDQPSPVASVPPPAPFKGPAGGYGSPFDGSALGGTVQAAPPVTAAPPPSAANPPAPHQAPDGQGRDRVADPVPAWEAQSARDQWSSSPLPGRPVAGGQATDGGPDWITGGRAAIDPAHQAGDTAPATSVMPARTQPTSSGLSSGPSGAGPESASPNWFAPRARPADTAPPATQAPADAAPADAADENDDWPGRYSWLDESEADQSLVATDESDAVDARAVDAGDAKDHAVPAASAPLSPGQDLVSDAVANDTPGSDALGSDSAASETRVSGASAGATAAAPAADAGPAPAAAEPEPGAAEPEAGAAGGEPPAVDVANPAPADVLVAVLRGVPRYHQPDCVLIRFMTEDDIQRLPAEQAKADGCTPCAACQPAE